MNENDRSGTPDNEGSEGQSSASHPLIPSAPPLYAGPTVASAQSVNLRVPLVNGLPPEQVRWTILVRLLLAIPQFFVLFFIGIAAFFVAVAVWFVAIFTGRVPQGMGAFLARFTRWSVRVSAYFYLLTDEYPAFDGNDDDQYPVGVELPEPVPLNQMAVLFRIVLAVPAYIIGTAVSGGFTALLLPFWISALILGRLPGPIYRVAATITRYSARSTAYLLMLTPDYPWGWKGDDEGVSPSEGATSDPRATRFNFHLTGWAKAWIWIFIVVGVIYDVRVRRY